MLLRIAQTVLAFIGGSGMIYAGTKNGYLIGFAGILFAYFCTVIYVKVSDWRLSLAQRRQQLDA